MLICMAEFFMLCFWEKDRFKTDSSLCDSAL